MAKRKKTSLAEALELLEKPTGEGREERTSSKKIPRKGKMGEKPASKNGKIAEGGKNGKVAEGGIEDESSCNQLGRAMAKRKEPSASGPRTRTKATKEEREARKIEVENYKHLCKLPHELWERIFNNFEENDLFPLALSCRYFRQKQVELVARNMQSGPEREFPCRALRTNIRGKLEKGQPASADYLRFCSKEEGSVERDILLATGSLHKYIRRLAAFHGHLPLLQELLADFSTHGPYSYSSSACDAARGGQLKTVQWLMTRKGIPKEYMLPSRACEGGNLEMIRWLRNKGYSFVGADAFGGAARGGQLEVLKWLRSKGCHWDAGACTEAAKKGHLEVLKWLRSEGCPWESWTCCGAAEGGHLEVLKWLRSEGCPGDAIACSFAAKGGHLEVLKWLRSEGCPWDESACAYAAERGDFEVLKWLRSEGCPLNREASTAAAERGDLEMLRWLRSEGCPWNEKTCTAAVIGGHLDVLKYAHENGCPWNMETWESSMDLNDPAVEACHRYLDNNHDWYGEYYGDGYYDDHSDDDHSEDDHSNDDYYW